MKKTTLRVVVAGAVCAAVAVFLPQLSQAQVAKCSDLFISEYVDGPGKNKAVEIYNPTEGDIDLSGYSIHVYMNGAPTPLITPLAGVLSSHGVHVLSNPLADAEVLGKAQQTSVHYNPNGDDAVALEKDGTLLDIVGEIGVDPGPDGWPVTPAGLPAAATKANGLVRMPACGAGEHDWTHCQEHWKVYAQDDYRRLGWHMSACRRGAPEVGFKEVSVACYENGCGYVPLEVQISHRPLPLEDVTVYFYDGTFTAGPAATAGVDYRSASSIAPIGFSSSSVFLTETVYLEVYGDAFVEPMEGATVMIDLIGPATTGSGVSEDVYIVNDDVIGIEEPDMSDYCDAFFDMASSQLVISTRLPVDHDLLLLNSLGQTVWTAKVAGIERLEVQCQAFSPGVYSLVVAAHGYSPMYDKFLISSK